MSKIFRSFPVFIAAGVLILQFFTNAGAAQDIEAKITIDSASPSLAKIEGSFLRERPSGRAKRLSLIQEYAGVIGLGQRFSALRIGDSEGSSAVLDRYDQEIVGPMTIKSWSYTADLTPSKSRSAAAHISWVNASGGILMLDDLLPQFSGKSARIKIELPTGWKLYSTVQSTAGNEFEVADIEKSAFFIGRDWRERNATNTVNLLISGDWLFTDDEAATLAAEVYSNYEKLFGSLPNRNAHIAIVRFPGNIPPGNWEAGTRGSSITIASSDMPFKSQSIQRLHEQLRHEIFHLWIPNGVNLSGNYDWFYEGFALYQSLKLGVAVNRIGFNDFLDTLSRAHNIDSSRRPNQSLIDASKNRWTGANTQTYARGILVAFLCDLALLEKSKGKTSISNILRKIYDRHRPPNAAQDGGAAVLTILRSYPELVPIIDRNITGVMDIDWIRLLAAGGLEVEALGNTVKLKAAAKPTSRQKDLLDKLGYNSWRKMANGNR